MTGPATYNEAANKVTLPLTVLYGINVAELGSAVLSIDTILSGTNIAYDLPTEDYTVISGSWVIRYTVEKAMQNRILIVYPKDSPVFSKLEIKCSPVMFSMRMTAHGVFIDENGFTTRQYIDGYYNMTSSEKSDIQMEFANKYIDYYLSFDDPFLTLDDGSIIMLQRINDMFDAYGGSFWYPTNYYDVEKLYSLTFCGEEYFFNGAP